MHWSEKYLNQPYVPKTGDCMSLAEQVAVEVLGIHPGLPAAHETSLRKQAAQIEALKDNFGVRVEKPIDGHPVLFLPRGRFWHAGVVALLDDEVWVLHNDQMYGAVIRQRLRDIPAWRLPFEGFYRWLATK